MTPEQRERLQAAARELSSALTAVGDDLRVDVTTAEVTTLGDERRKFVYSTTVEAITREVIR